MIKSVNARTDAKDERKTFRDILIRIKRVNVSLYRSRDYKIIIASFVNALVYSRNVAT